MIELHTFGRVELKSSDGHEIRAVLAQPKRAALLTYLAVAQPRGFQRRDALLALFWPELDQDRARAALRKAVHHLRKALGEEAVEGRGDEELRVAERIVWCDAAAFEVALTGGDPEGAVSLYRGPFLEAFFVPDAPEFERWMESERSRLHRRAFEAAWQVTEAEQRSGNTYGAAYWARRAAAFAPADEAAIRRLMTLLDQLGDRAGAVQAYEDFARRMKADLDIEPSAETQGLVRGIRSAPVAAPVPDGSPTATAPAVVGPQPASTSRRSRRWSAGVLALVALAGLAAALSLWPRARAAPSLSADLVAVFPFAARGDPSLEYLEEGLSSLLSTGLDGAGDLRSVDPRAVLSVLAAESGRPSDPARAGRLAAGFGAGWYVLGDVVGTGPQLRIDATLYDVRQRGRGIGFASAQGSIDSLFGLVDQVTGQLIAAQRGDSARAVSRLAALTTHSIPALKAYLEGERQYRRGSFPRAIAGYQRALALDSTFALAYYRLAGAYAWSGSDSSLHAAELAVRFGQRLAASERELLRALLAYEEGRADEAERQYREILRRRPQELDALFQLGEILFHHNVSRGRLIGESRPFFERARAWNHSDAPLIHLVELAALERDYEAFDSLMAEIQPESHFWLTGRMVRALQLGGKQQWEAFETEFRKASEREMATVGGHTLYLLNRDSVAELALRVLVEPARSAELRTIGHLLFAHLHMGGGRWRAAAASLDSARALDPVGAVGHEGMLHVVPLLPFAPAQLRKVHATIAATVPARTLDSRIQDYAGDDTLQPAIREYTLGLLEARMNRTAEALRRAVTLDRVAGGGPSGAADAFAASIRAQVHLAAGAAAEAEAALDRTKWVPRARTTLTFSPVLGKRHERFLRAEALDRQGRHEQALGWLASFAEHSPGGRIYLAPAHFRMGEILERLGRRDEAATAYRRFATLWNRADPEFQGLVSEARRRVARLTPEPSGRQP